MHKEDNPDVVLVKCDVTEGNPDGFYRLDKSLFVEGEHEIYVPELEPSKYESKTVAELKTLLAEAGMDVPEHAKKADLVALCLSFGG